MNREHLFLTDEATVGHSHDGHQGVEVEIDYATVLLRGTPETLHALHLAAQQAAMGAALAAVEDAAAFLDEVGCPECGDRLTVAHSTVRCRPCDWTPDLSKIRLRALAVSMIRRIEERR